MRSGAGAEIIFIKQEVWTLEDARIKKMHFLPPLVWSYFYLILSGILWLELEPKYGTKVEPGSEPKINNFGYATLLLLDKRVGI